MAELNAEAIAGMIRHMNDDHPDSVVAYARHYGGLGAAESAHIVALDSLGMEIEALSEGATTRVRVAFDHEIADAMDGRRTLVAMAKEASTPS